MEKKWMIAGGVVGVLVVALVVVALQGGSIYNPKINPSDFTTDITNKYFTLPVGKKMVYEAETEDGLEKIQIEILDETKTVMGVETLVYWDRVWLNGELIEDTRDYLAQDREGNVWYFGEDVDNYENGKLKDHAGSWIAGVDGAMPGIWIKGNHKVGDSYRQEYYKGEAEDMRDVVAVGETVTTKLGTYTDCIKMYDWTPLDPESKEHKYYCPEVGGMVLEEHLVHGERLELVSAESYNPTINPSDFTTEITNKYFTLPVGKMMVYEAETEDGLEKIQIEILDETKTIMGVKTLVFWDRVWLDGELIEDTRDYLAQDKEGNVWYFGEDVDNYEDGKLKDHAGAWIAGIDGAKPGIWMKANPQVGDSYRQEYYKGEAEDMAEVLATNERVTVPYGTFKNCVKTLEWSPLEPDLKAHKYYCPEVGGTVLEVELVGGERKVEERVELIDVKMGVNNAMLR